MDLNLVVVSGRVATPPEIKIMDSGATLVRILVTVRSETPRRRVDVLPVSIWDPPNIEAIQGTTAGERVWAAGSIQRRFWEAPDGRRSRLELIAEQLYVKSETPSASVRCPECGRVFDLGNATDAAEWSFGHDCEVSE